MIKAAVLFDIVVVDLVVEMFAGLVTVEDDFIEVKLAGTSVFSVLTVDDKIVNSLVEWLDDIFTVPLETVLEEFNIVCVVIGITSVEFADIVKLLAAEIIFVDGVNVADEFVGILVLLLMPTKLVKVLVPPDETVDNGVLDPLPGTVEALPK